MKLDFTLHTSVAEVGGSFAGQLSRPADDVGSTTQSQARAVNLTLQYWTEGAGNTDRRSVKSLRFDLDSHGGLYTSFDLPVPIHAPISYDGSLIRVRYEISASVDLKMAPDPSIERRVVVIPLGGMGVYDRPHPLPVPRSSADLRNR